MGTKSGLEAMLEKSKQQKIKALDEQTQRKIAEIVKSASERLTNSRSYEPIFFTDRDKQADRLFMMENREMLQAASELSDYRVTENFIRETWQPRQYPTYRTYFNGSDRAAFVFLVSGRSPDVFIDLNRNKVPELPESLRLTPEAALEQINGLCHDKLRALVWLYAYGLRAHHLSIWPGDNHTNSFLIWHGWTLESLVIDGGRTIEEAVHLLQGKSEAEMSDIRKSIAQQDTNAASVDLTDRSLTGSSFALHHSNNNGESASNELILQGAKIKK